MLRGTRRNWHRGCSTPCKGLAAIQGLGARLLRTCDTLRQRRPRRQGKGLVRAKASCARTSGPNRALAFPLARGKDRAGLRSHTRRSPQLHTLQGPITLMCSQAAAAAQAQAQTAKARAGHPEMSLLPWRMPAPCQLGGNALAVAQRDRARGTRGKRWAIGAQQTVRPAAATRQGCSIRLRCRTMSRCQQELRLQTSAMQTKPLICEFRR